MKLALSLLLFSLLYSCGDGEEGGNLAGIELGKPMAANRDFTNTERDVAFSICDSFRYKHTNFPSDFAGTPFRYLIKEQPCSGSDINTTISAQITGGLTLSSSYTGAFFSDVDTHQSGLIANICTKVLSNALPSTDESISVDEKKQYFFTEGSDGNQKEILILIGKKEGTGYISNEGYLINVTTTSGDSPSLRGLVNKKLNVKFCPDGSPNRFESLEMTYQ